MPLRKTTEEFIKDAISVHGDRYDYSKVNYINNRTKVVIICPEHGEFLQTPHDHLNNNKCPKCALKERTQKRTKTNHSFIEESIKIHNNKYDYSKSVYKNAHTHLTIICPEHGEFSMKPNNHLKGQGCPICANSQKGEYQRGNTENFISKSQKLHNNKYDYSKVDYYNNRQKICIICPEHGEFWQQPRDHLHGHGCPQCGSKYNASETKILKTLQDTFDNIIYQYSPEWLSNVTSRQSLDFYLPDYNIAIEYQGRQHFIPNKKFGGELEFDKIVERDKRKFNKCKEQNVKLFYISFEKEKPESYFAPIYTNTNDLINKIKEYITNGL